MNLDFIPSGNPENPQTISFNTMRILVGVLGMALPVILISGGFLFGSCHLVLESLSAYYHGAMRNAFVGVLCAVALFLFSYHGYDWRDFLATKVASAAALGIAFFACYLLGPLPPCMSLTPGTNFLSNLIHTICAFVFFLDIGLMSLCLFTRKDPLGRKPVSSRKKVRNFIYRFCGIVILACLGLILVFNGFYYFAGFFKTWIVISLESLALLAFGISWLVKGEVFKGLRDLPVPEGIKR